MKDLVFSTGNHEKFLIAKQVCEHHGIQLVQKQMDVAEIQEEDPKVVALDKANKAYATAKVPVVVTDDSWSFNGLRGFPGVYMHSMNKWFTPEDFLRLTLPLEDRKAVMTQHLVYTDSQEQKLFTNQLDGEILKEARGNSDHANHKIISLNGDNGLSIAEAYDQAADKSSGKYGLVWHEFAKWFSER